MSDFIDKESIDDDNWVCYLVSAYQWCIVLDNTDSAERQNVNVMKTIADNFEAVRRQLILRGYDIDIKFIYTSDHPVRFNFIPKVYDTMLPGAFDFASFYRTYLESFSKRLDAELLATLTAAPVSVNPTLSRLLADYLREYVDFENIGDTVARIRNINNSGDVIRLFTDEMLKLGREECKFLASMLWIYQTGLSHHDIMELAEGYNKLTISSILSGLSRFMCQTDERNMYIRNKYMLATIVKMLGYDRQFTKEVARKTSKHFFNKIKDLKTAEDFLLKSKKSGWWLYADVWMSLVPEKYPPEWSELMQSAHGIGVDEGRRDLARLQLISRCGGFTTENAHKVFRYYRYSWSFNIQERRMWYWKLQEKGQEVSKEQWDNLYMAYTECQNTRNPTRLELCNYLEALVHAENTKQLSIELGNPPVVNYVWNNSLYLFAWLNLRELTGEWLIQEQIRDNGLIIKGVLPMVAYLLQDKEAWDFYVAKDKKNES